MFRLFVLSALVACALGAATPKGLVPLWEARIVGGRPANIEEFPYIASMRYGGTHRCGMAIIAKNLCVTAAHCIDGTNVALMSISAGTSSRTALGTNIKVIQMIKHERYNSRTIENDVAILVLASPLTYSTQIQPIGLATAGSVVAAGTTVATSGWGALREGGSAPAQLQTVDVPVVSNADCEAAYGKGEITDSMMCAGVKTGGMDACQGDSGGPLAIGSPLGNTLVGIVSWGYGCARPNYPGVYASVGNLRNWIDGKVEQYAI